MSDVRTRPSLRRAAAAAALATGALALGVTPVGAGARQRVAVDDPGLPRQWALARIGGPMAWSVATGVGTTIAVVDSGVDVDHPDLRGQVVASTDCVGHDEVPGGCLDGAGTDDAGHGTHVAGIAAAATDNGRGVAGVAPGARLLAVRVLAARCSGSGGDCEAEGTESDVAEGIRWAADHGADVVNLSLGSVTQAVIGPGRTFTEALDYAWNQGAIPVLVAGNDLVLPGSLVDVPAVVVAATDADDRAATYSNGVGNVRWAVSAPGGESDTAASCESPTPRGILSTFYRAARDGEPATSGYACVAGTSMAAPHVAGGLALLRSAGFGPREAVDRLLATAVDLGPPGPDATFGAGRIDLAAALAGVAPTGQPVRGWSDGGAAPTDEGGVTTAPPTSEAAADDASTTTVTAGAPTPTEAPPAGDAASPDGAPGDEQAGRAAAARRPPGGDEEVPAGALTVAVLALAAVASGHAWRYLGRRTPPP